MMTRPDTNEYAEYYHRYISLVPDGDIITILRNQQAQINEMFAQITEDKAGYRYAEGKWSIRQVAGHLLDMERVFAYRALCIARGDKSPLPGADQNVYAEGGRFDDRTLADITDEYSIVRDSTLAMVSRFNDEESRRTGTASGWEVSVRALIYMIAGHTMYHIAILNDRYLTPGTHGSPVSP